MLTGSVVCQIKIQKLEASWNYDLGEKGTFDYIALSVKWGPIVSFNLGAGYFSRQPANIKHQLHFIMFLVQIPVEVGQEVF